MRLQANLIYAFILIATPSFGQLLPTVQLHDQNLGPLVPEPIQPPPQSAYLSPAITAPFPFVHNPAPAVQLGNHLSVNDVENVLAQAIGQAQSISALATIAVVDRVGNVLAVYRMTGQNTQVTIGSSFPATVMTGLDGIQLPAGADGDALAAISKAITGAYLSSSGNAFSTRTASQIIQEHFNPGEDNQPSGPLFGVQFSQLACSDFSRRYTGGTLLGPQRAPLGLAADAGGFPLYLNAEVVGGVGVISDQQYGLDQSILNFDFESDELIALAATQGYAAPLDIRAERITIDGKTLRYADVTLADLSPTNQSFSALPAGVGTLLSVNAYHDGVIRRGAAFNQPESGIRADEQTFAAVAGHVFVDQNNDLRYALRGGTDATALGGVQPLSQAEVTTVLQQAMMIANRSRAQIRRPLGSAARVTITVVDTLGQILGSVRSADAPVFSADVALQKARTASFFSNPNAAAFLAGITTPAAYLDADLMVRDTASIPDYVLAAQDFIGPGALSDGTAFSDRAGGNLSRPFYADGIQNNPHGPFSKSFSESEWSVFSTGLQSDLIMNKLIQHVLFAAAGVGVDVDQECTQASSGRLANGIQIFPGSVPIYRGDQLIGGIGVSGDGVDQDDMIAFLGLHQAAAVLGQSINNAPTAIRADNLTPQGVRLRYVQCPQSPFIDSNEERVCRGK